MNSEWVWMTNAASTVTVLGGIYFVWRLVPASWRQSAKNTIQSPALRGAGVLLLILVSSFAGSMIAQVAMVKVPTLWRDDGLYSVHSPQGQKLLNDANVALRQLDASTIQIALGGTRHVENAVTPDYMIVPIRGNEADSRDDIISAPSP